MEKKLGVFFTTTTIVTPYQQQRHTSLSLSIFSNPNANIQTPLYFPLPLSLSTIRTLLRIHPLRRLHHLFFPRNYTTPVSSSSSLSLRSFRCTPSLVGDLEVPRGLFTSA